MTPTDSPQPQKRRTSMTAMYHAWRCAIHGFLWALRSEPHMRFHMGMTIGVIALGAFAHLTPTEWCMVFLAIGLVLAAELLNTATEITLDLLVPMTHPQVKAAKDVAAAAVWVSAMTAGAIGSVIFIPKFIRLFA